MLDSPGLLFLAGRDVETCPSQRRHLILAEKTHRPCNSWGKTVSKTVHMVVLITAAGPRVAAQRTCWLACQGCTYPAAGSGGAASTE